MVEVASTRSTAANRIPPEFNSRIRPNPPLVKESTSSSSDTAKQLITNQIASEVWSQLPLARLADEVGHRGIEQILRFANSSFTRIVECHSELRQWTGAICKAAIEIRGAEQASEDLLHQLTEEITSGMMIGELFSLPPRPFIDCDFAELKPDEALSQAVNRCETLCGKLANEVFDLLDRLHKHQLIGKLQQGDTTCKFDFFRRVAILDVGERQSFDRTRETIRGAVLGSTVRTVDTVESAMVAIEHRTAHYTHFLHNSTSSNPCETKQPLPQQYLNLITSCPDWLRPCLRVVEGDLIRIQLIEFETGRESRLDEQVVLTRRVVELPAIYFDPAVVLEDYVLAGWDEQEIADEKKRLLAEEHSVVQQGYAKTAKRLQTLAFVFGAISVGLIALSTSATPVYLAIAILFGLATTIAAASSTHFTLSAQDQLSVGRVLLLAGLSGTTVFAIQSLVYSVLNWSAALFGLAALFAVSAWLLFTVKLGQAVLESSRVD